MQSASLIPVDAAGFVPFSELLAKVRQARPLTIQEKIDTAEGLTEPAVELMADPMVGKLAQARRLAARAVQRDEPMTANPYSEDDKPLERDAWFDEYERILSEVETDR